MNIHEYQAKKLLESTAWPCRTAAVAFSARRPRGRDRSARVGSGSSRRDPRRRPRQRRRRQVVKRSEDVPAGRRSSSDVLVTQQTGPAGAR